MGERRVSDCENSKTNAAGIALISGMQTDERKTDKLR